MSNFELITLDEFRGLIREGQFNDAFDFYFNQKESLDELDEIKYGSEVVRIHIIKQNFDEARSLADDLIKRSQLLNNQFLSIETTTAKAELLAQLDLITELGPLIEEVNIPENAEWTEEQKYIIIRFLCVRFYYQYFVGDVNFSKTLEKCKSLINTCKDNEIYSIESNLFNLPILMKLGKYEEIKSILKNGIEYLKLNNFHYLLFLYYDYLSTIRFIFQEDIDNSEIINNMHELVKKMQSPVLYFSDIQRNILIRPIQNDADLEYSKNLLQRLTKNNEIDKKTHKIMDYGLRASYYYLKKDWEKSLEYQFKLLSIDKLEMFRKSLVLKINAFIFFYLGDYETSIKYLIKQLEIDEKLGNIDVIANTLNNLGSLYQYQGNFKKASELLQKSIVMRKEINFIDGLNNAIFDYFMVLYWNGEINEARDQLNELHKLKSNDLTKLNFEQQVRISIAEGLMLKAGSRVREKVKALEVFEELYGKINDVNFEEIHRMILYNYCDLLIMELSQFGDNDVLELVIKLTDEIYELAQFQQSRNYIIEALVLKAKLNIIQTKFVEAQNLFEQAKINAEETNITLLIKKIDREIKDYHNNLSEMKRIVRKGNPMHKLIEMTRMMDYYKLAKKLVDIE